MLQQVDPKGDPLHSPSVILPYCVRTIAVGLSVAGLVLATVEQCDAGESASIHWSFQPVIRPEIPSAQHIAWPRNPIDHFILGYLDQQDVTPSRAAKLTSLLRRVTLDLTGLSPTRAELNEFTSSASSEAYEQVVERLLASPHFGERWARHWLDVARYADSAGHEFDSPRQLWKYRDWVIGAINEDKPYDEFLIEQLAGDLVVTDDRGPLVATGFVCNSLKNYGDHSEATIDRVNAFGTACLGLTLSCAQCHNHKTDPITQKEYYQLFAFFHTAEDVKLNFSSLNEIGAQRAVKESIAVLKQKLAAYQNGPNKDPLSWAARLNGTELRQLPSEVRQAINRVSHNRTEEQITLILAGHREAMIRYQTDLEDRIDEWSSRLTEEEMAAMPRMVRNYLEIPRSQRPTDRPILLLQVFWPTDGGYLKRTKMIKELEANIPDVVTTLVLRERSVRPKTHVFLAGDHRALGDEVSPGVPKVLPPMKTDSDPPTRLDLAKWVASRENPLTARVAVNRIWQRYFGAGLVETSDNFGTQTTAPIHLDLLNWLAAEFMDHNWSAKHIHRLIVTSATYRQSSHVREDLIDRDPTNKLLARQQRLRLEAEIIRDVALAASGLLDSTVGGPSVFPYQPEGTMTGRADRANWIADTGANSHRRGMYTHYWRLTPHPFLSMFDMPDASAACARRSRSNTPLQALTLLNDPWFSEAAVALAKRILESTADETIEQRVCWTFENCLGRTPTTIEQDILTQLLVDQQQAFQEDSARATEIVGESTDQNDAVQLASWIAVARAVLNLDEFITRE
ncbi:MAG: DUF1549 and DUF1553 domain-containing protein [Pirellulales bacterium]